MIILPALGWKFLMGNKNPCFLHPSAKKTMELDFADYRGYVVTCKPGYSRTMDVKPFQCRGEYINPPPSLCVPTALYELAAYGPWSGCVKILEKCAKVRLRTKESGSRMWVECQNASQQLASEYQEAYGYLGIQGALCSDDECIWRRQKQFRLYLRPCSDRGI